MAIDLYDLIPGRVFHFKVGPRRVLAIEGDQVIWEWADEKQRSKSARPGGSMWLKSFAQDASLDVVGVQPARRMDLGGTTVLLSGEVVDVLDKPVTVKIRTLCPKKYVVVDLALGRVLELDGNGTESAGQSRIDAARQALRRAAALIVRGGR